MDSQATTINDEEATIAPGSPADGSISSLPALNSGGTADHDEPLAVEHGAVQQSLLDLSSLPLTFVLPTHFELDELHDFERKLRRHGAPLTYDESEARLFLGKIEKQRRAVLELKARNVFTEPIDSGDRAARPAKRRKIESGIEIVSLESDDDAPQHDDDSLEFGLENTVKVVKCDWIDASLEAGRVLPPNSYLVYDAKRVPRPKSPSRLPPSATKLERSTTYEKPIVHQRGASADSSTSTNRYGIRNSQSSKRPILLSQTTSEHDLIEQLSPPPAWVLRGTKYACQRRSPNTNPNDGFIEQLKAIRLARELQSDQIGVRAYSTAIAAIAAYTRPIISSAEVAQLPGCHGKISALFDEYDQVGTLKEARDAEKDEQLQTLRLFYDIWGVGSITAREFYGKGWRDLDDVVEYGWSTLSRVQQIGLKYYDEFKLKMARSEVEEIHAIIVSALRDIVSMNGADADGVRSCIVGGYRRGKLESGDVDVIVSHRDENETSDIISPLVEHLYALGYVTHNLGVTLSSTRRGQKTLPYIGGARHGGHGFDSLDKALVVWQDAPKPAPTEWPSMTGDEKAAWRKQNPSGIPHRRVDIIVSPWSTIGCAVLGWSAGTTFERDLRRYAKNAKGWKFDSSGVRDRVSGKVLDLERRRDGEAPETPEEAERLVFEGLGLEYIPPEERCTG